jgi:hypothetical protein
MGEYWGGDMCCEQSALMDVYAWSLNEFSALVSVHIQGKQFSDVAVVATPYSHTQIHCFRNKIEE